MSDIAVRYRAIADLFDGRVRGVPADGWDRPAPCDGWVARDVVRHLVEWVPSMVLGGAGLPLPELPSVDDDPVEAWAGFDAHLRAVLDDPELAARPSTSQAGTYTVEEAIATFVISDVLVHTWDLARATGQDESLDPGEVHRAYEGMAPIEGMLKESGQFGPYVEVADDADEQTKLLAVCGRRV
jgi:uncharacterized protein (TIGR03086 family)